MENEIDCLLDTDSFNDPFWKYFLDVLRREEARPKTLVIDPQAAGRLTKVIGQFRRLIDESGCNTGNFTVEYFPLFHSVGVHIDMDSFECHKPAQLSKLLDEISTFEIYPLTNGNIRLGFTIQHFFVELKQ